MTVLRFRTLLLIATSAALLGGCGARDTTTATGPRALPEDSARILERAIASARPAYPTQEQALSAGVYRRPMLAAAPAPREPEPVRRAEPPPAPAPRRDAAPAPAPVATAEAAPPPPIESRPSVALLGEEEANPEPRSEVSRSEALERRPRPGAASTIPPAAVAAPPVAAPTATPAVETDGPQGGAGADPEATGRYVVQVAAFRDVESARRVLGDVARSLPSIGAAIEEEAGLFRVVVGGWQEEALARERLPAIQERYPSAWIRIRSIP